ncbi:hypothetical protein V8E55_007946 [Tylopilus felleus]
MIQMNSMLVLVSLAQVVLGTSTNSTSSSVPQPTCDGTMRSLWSILGSCASTLLICVWQAIHFNLDDSMDLFRKPVVLVLSSFFAPEIVVSAAAHEWAEARKQVALFREKGYQWSMAHSFFAEMGGFVYHDEEGNTGPISSENFLVLCQEKQIANPFITVKEIKARSKSDTFGKAFLAFQLLWFTLQVIVRGSHGLAVTLIELDTVSMAALNLLILWLWLEKPLRAGCPHTFYPQGVDLYPRTGSESVLKSAWKPEPGYLSTFMANFMHKLRARPDTSSEEVIALVTTDESNEHSQSDSPKAETEGNDIWFFSLCGTWLVLGGLHLIAWNFHFPTEAEKILWRVASLVLAGGPLAFFVLILLYGFASSWRVNVNDSEDSHGHFRVYITYAVLILSVVSRTLLVALMLAGLRSLPASAYQTVSWIAYIPHL